MSLILAIETSTDNCSVAIGENGENIAHISVKDRSSHSSRLPLYIQNVLKQSGMQIENIDAVAVSKGPGSFTGLRIGVSLAKGICFAISKPLISVNTLQSLVSGSKKLLNNNTYLITLADAGTNECYYAVYDKNYYEIVAPDVIVFNESIFNKLPSDKNYLISGYRFHKWIDFLADKKNVQIVETIYPDSQHLLETAHIKYQKNEFEKLSSFEPYYLRDFKARDFSNKIKKVLYPELFNN